MIRSATREEQAAFLRVMRPIAEVYGRIVPGDSPELLLAQAQLETGHGLNSHFNYNNWGGIKISQTALAMGVQIPDAAGDLHADYASLEACAIDRIRILFYYLQKSPHSSVIDLLDKHWAPNQGYRGKVQKLMARLRDQPTDPTPAPAPPPADPGYQYTDTEPTPEIEPMNPKLLAIVWPLARRALQSAAKPLWRQLWRQVFIAVAEAERKFDTAAGAVKKEHVEQRIDAWIAEHIQDSPGPFRWAVDAFSDVAAEFVVGALNRFIGKDWVKEVDEAEDYLAALVGVEPEHAGRIG